jgi:hypothetical protein
MDTALITIGVFATAMLFGSMAFFSTVMAPLIFTRLDAETAGRFIRQVFPWYYFTVILLAAVAALSLAVTRLADATAITAVAAVGVIARQALMPRINRARDASTGGDLGAGRQFSRLHRLSVWINAAQMIVVAIVLARFV